MMLDHWAARWGLPAEAVADLRRLMGAIDTDPVGRPDTPEGAVQTAIRLEASRLGMRLWRNNVGAGRLENGSFVRWGLCNDSEQMNRSTKSSDLVGIRPRLITADMVGHTIGQFVAREVKRGGWRYTGTDREVAQLRFIELVTSLGGDAAFTTGEGAL